MINQIPNFITLGNLFSGCCALVFLQHQQVEQAGWCTASCFLCDYLDGSVARALKASSPLGKQLDSLADVVSFGVVPGAMMYYLMALALGNEQAGVQVAALPAFVLSAFSAYRLGKFNLDPRQTHYFMGLSTPASTLFVLGLLLSVHFHHFGIEKFLLNMGVLYALTATLSVLLIAEIPMFGMKIGNFKGVPLVLLLLSVPMVFFFKELALTILVILYIFFSILFRHEVYRGN